MPEHDFDEGTLRALAGEGNETALDRLADLADARGDLNQLSELLDEGSEHAGRLLTRRAVENRDLRELQRLSDAGSSNAETELERLLGQGRRKNMTNADDNRLHPTAQWYGWDSPVGLGLLTLAVGWSIAAVRAAFALLL